MLCQEELEHLYVPKLIIQPLIENAIYHGLQSTENGGIIVITLDRDDFGIALSVYDNGVGINEDKLSELNSMLSTNLQRGKFTNADGYGIYNINTRIKSFFGSQYGLSIESKAGKYTLVKIQFPAYRPPEPS